MNKIFVFLIYIILLFSCSEKKIIRDESDLFLNSSSFRPQYSPDGKFLYFSFYYKGNSKLFFYDRETGNVNKFNIVDEEKYNIFDPTISINMEYIAFSSPNINHCFYDIFIFNNTIKDVKKLTESNGLYFYPLLSSDNQYLYFKQTPNGKHYYNFYNINLDNNEIKRITNKNFYKLSNCIISNDNKYIILGTEMEYKKNESQVFGELCYRIVKINIKTYEVIDLIYGDILIPMLTENDEIIFGGKNSFDRTINNISISTYPLGIYKMDLDSNKLGLILSSEKIDSIISEIRKKRYESVKFKDYYESVHNEDFFSIKYLQLSPDGKYILFRSAYDTFYEISIDGNECKEIIFSKNEILKHFKIYNEEIIRE